MENKPKYQLVSFDIWGTLLETNPVFTQERNKLFAQEFEYDNLIALKKIKDKVDLSLDNEAEETGQDFNFSDRIRMMRKELGIIENNGENNFNELRDKLNKLFLNNLPNFIEKSTLELFREIKKNNIKIAVISNTGFLHGDVMRQALKSLGASEYIDYYVFSNEIQHSKPHPKIFDELIKQSNTPANNIIHVGNSVISDYEGAWKSGMVSVLFDPSNKHDNRLNSVNNLKELIEIFDHNKVLLHYRNMTLYHLKINNGSILTKDDKYFDTKKYSKFKYGDGEIARNYGHELAVKFIETYPNIFDSKKELIISTSPYKSIVKGSSGIVRGFKNYINQYLYNLKQSPIIDISILKKEMFQGDYGSFSREKRETLMHNNDLYIMEDLIKDKSLILIDDARITGSHEQNLITFLKDKWIRDVYFIYIADMDSTSAQKQPDIEDIMNHGWVDNTDKLSDIMNSNEFILNARVCKFILSEKNRTTLPQFLKTLKKHVIYNLYCGILGDNYEVMDIYKESFKLIRDELINRNMIIDDNLA